MPALSKQGLGRLHDSMELHVNAGSLPGLVTLVAQGDEVHVDTIGTPSFVDNAPLRRDAIFRIASLTKPITALATMTLVEEGVLRLEEPIDDLVPELAGRRVLRSIDADLDDTVPAGRPITLEDLLSYRFGFGSVMAPPGSYPIQRAEAELGLQSIGGPPWPPVAHDVDGWIGALGSLPLMYQPGEQWLYNTSAQVLGVLLARACGQDLGSVVRERIFEPSGMTDTGFTVPAEKLSRLTTAYQPDAATGELSVLDDPGHSWWSTLPSFPDASGWLVSTIDDYWLFVSTLLSGRTRQGERILSPETVALVTTDRLTPSQREAAALFLGERGGWGLGLEVPATGTSDHCLPSGIGWDGGTGTTWRSNPRSGVTGIMFTQRAATSPAPSPVVEDFWAGVNAATATR
ncbi:serine hydrolase domain-containing protein [Candidatus Nephthysia bennettiae]|uniref:Beta-lactamase family protein n=1 Tax=Candidatus Nephthysia bennettiae TaxID=3127016 RepID=A0A934N451_9BACT|nr:beta-lactamase family protein [Candidatus Dormibacteraeota bacterium]MBJ7611249.1 beta-lactamase family protein [Candidatus Dormibacteraeota bacterium]